MHAVFSVQVQRKELFFQECMPLDKGAGAREKALQSFVDAWLDTLSVQSGSWECSPSNLEARDMPGTFVLQHKILQQKGTEDHTCWATA